MGMLAYVVMAKQRGRVYVPTVPRTFTSALGLLSPALGQ